MKIILLLKRHRADLITVVIAGIWLVFWRAVLHTPWGIEPVATTDGLVNTGILYNPGDTWSYLSWVQQYHHGASLAGLLYTTEPHGALLWMFPLWLIGHAATLTGLPVIGVYNAAGFLGALGAVFFFRLATAALRLPRIARDAATAALVIGSGGSWLWHLAHKLHLASPADGGDLFFLDFFPSTTFITYAYHSIGLLLLIGLWWTATEAENRLVARDRAGGWLTAMAGFALLLGFSRPYEPLAFLGAWGLKTAWHGFGRHEAPHVWKTSLLLAAFFAVTLAAGIGWTVWVSRQPVWSTFAHESLALGLPRSAWTWTLCGWGVLIALGTPFAWRADRRLAVLPLAATVLLAAILLGLGGANTKLASGLILGPILLAGWGFLRLQGLLARIPKSAQIPLIVLSAGALMGLPTFYLVQKTIGLHGPTTIDRDLLTLARRIPVQSGRPPAIVFTDGDTGTILPGLVGARVWVGHWSLSPHYKTKIAQLRAAGLDPAHPPADPVSAQTSLAAILTDAPFDYALLDHRVPRVIDSLKEDRWETIADTPRWILLRPRLIAP